MRVVRYNFNHRARLSLLLCGYFQEMHPDTYRGDYDKAGNMIDVALGEGRTIYVLEDDNNIAVGFMIVYLNNQFNMTDNYVVCEYMYIDQDYRSSSATLHLFNMLGRISEDYKCDVLGVTMESSSNINNIKRLGGKPIATTYIVDKEDVAKHYKRYKSRIER